MIGLLPLLVPLGGPLTPPVEFDDRIRLLGYRLAQHGVSPGEEVSLTMLWQVSGDLRPPVASFTHLLGGDGRPRAQHDGWGTAVRGLEIDDIIVHHVRLPVPVDTEPGIYRLQIGVYSPDTMTRWPVQTPDGTVIHRVWLSEVEVF